VDSQPGILPDLACERTVFSAPYDGIALLFSDGQFELPPNSAPVYAVIDAALERPVDGAVSSLEIRGGEAAAMVAISGPSRQFAFTGVSQIVPTTAPSGNYVISHRLDPNAPLISASLNSADAWPENDALVARTPPPPNLEKWIVGSRGLAVDWRRYSPAALPVDPAAYLAASIIVLDDIAADELSAVQRDRLMQYVRDLGGSVAFIGGGRAFAAGGYPGTQLDAMSPLASTPPSPTTHWMLLADGSGSMNAPASGGGGTASSRWQVATEAMKKVVPRLPPEDLLSTGSFAEALTWWMDGKPVSSTSSIALPPTGATARGPTNLRAALETIERSADGSMPGELLLLTDGDADLGDITPLAAAMKSKRIRLNLLAIGDGRGIPQLRALVDGTGGQLLQESNPSQWATRLTHLLRAAAPKLIESVPAVVQFVGPLAALPQRQVSQWNRTWLKSGAQIVAQAQSPATIVGADWPVGEGRVAALAFEATEAEIEQIGEVMQRAARDPRYAVNWQAGSQLAVSVEAIGNGQYLNDQQVTLEIASDADNKRIMTPIPQTGPGQYELSIPAPRAASICTVRVAGNAVQRFSVAGRYAPEFDAIGNNRPILEALARRNGGAVIEPTQMSTIDFNWPSQDVPLLSWFATGGALLIALGLLCWRWT
jgi:hypothetical protein